MDGIWADVKYALRGLLTRPLFTVVTALTLGVGIGATAAVYSVVRAALLKPLPYEEPGQLVQFWSEYSWKNAEFLLLRGRFPGFRSVFAYTGWVQTMPDPDGGPARALTVVETTTEISSTLGVTAALGRLFREGEDAPGSAPVAVLSHRLWRSVFGVDPGIVGRSIDLNGVRRTVVGVLPENFWFPSRDVDVFVPRTMDPANGAGSLMLVGRLDDGRSPGAMDAQLSAITRVLGENFQYSDPRWDRTRDASLTPLEPALLGPTRPALLLALGATALILLIACANVTALLLGRLHTRRGELAVRSALGAGRGRLARQLLAESLALALVSGLVGWAVAAAAFKVLVGALPLIPGTAETLHVDWAVFGAAMGVALGAGLLVGMGPLAALARTDLKGAMTGRGDDGTASGARLESGLVVAEVALAVTLVVGAGLLIRSVREMRTLDTGFDPEGVVTVDVVQGLGDFDMTERARNLRELARRAEALPGVVSASTIQQPPLRGPGWNFGLRIEDQPDVTESTLYRIVTPGYFETMRIRVLEGRAFRNSDGPDDPPAVVINRAMAERFWPGEDAIGKRISTGVDNRWATIVGVVEDVRIGGLREPIRPGRYVLAGQMAYTTDQHTLMVRTDGPTAVLVPRLRTLVAELDPRIAVARVEEMNARVSDAMGEARQLMILLSILGALALLLGVVGTYGVVSHWVTRRSRTWGILLALGVAPGRVVAGVLKRGGGLVLLGVTLGTGGALMGVRALRSFLFGVSPTDPGVLGLAVGTLALSGLLAAWIPARRAARTDPLTVLREE